VGGGQAMTATESTVPSEAGPGEDTPVPASDPQSTRSWPWWLGAALVVGYLLQLGWRLWLARSVPTPVAHADEDRYLLAARALAGGPGGLGNDTEAFRRLGYPLILTPIYWFTSDPFKVFHAAQAIGAVVNALTFPLCYLFARRVLHGERRIALIGAFLVATLPTVAYYGEFALTDSIFAPLGLAWLILLHAQLAGRTAWSRGAAALGAGAVVGYVYAMHVRGLVMLGIHGAVLAVLVITRRSRWTLPVASLVAALVVSRLDWVAQRLIGDRLEHGGIEPDGRMWSRLFDARGAVHIICDAAGQIWYTGVGTWGLAAVGLVVAVQRIRGRDTSGTDLAQRVTLVTAFAATALIALSSAAALPPDGRVSNHAYPRYVAFLAPIWAMLAIVALCGAGRRRALRLYGAAAAVIVGGAFLVLARQTDLVRETFEPFDTPEVSFLTNTWGALPIARATATALLLLAVFVFAIAAPRPARLARIALAGVLVLNVGAMEVINARSLRPMAAKQYATAPQLVKDIHLGPGDVVVTSKWVPLSPLLNHQREVYWGPLAEFDHRKNQPPSNATAVIAPWNTLNGVDDWDGDARGWRRVAGDPVVKWAVWLRNSDPRVGTVSTGSGR